MSLSDSPIFSELTTESTRIQLMTASYILEGNVYLPRAMKENRRLTNLLNSDKRFLAMTKVMMMNRETGDVESESLPFIQVNMDAIEIIKPID